MRIKRVIKVTSLIVSSIILICVLTSCMPDMGDKFEDIDDYYALFDEIITVGPSFSTDSYDMEDFYSNETTENNECPMDDPEEFEYLAVKCEEEIIMDEFALFMLSEKDCMVQVSLFVDSSMPKEASQKEDESMFYGTYILNATNTDYSFTFEKTTDPDDDDKEINQVTYQIANNKYSGEYTYDSESKRAVYEISIDGNVTKFWAQMTIDGLRITNSKSPGIAVYVKSGGTAELAHATVSLVANKWNSFYIKDFTINGAEENFVTVKEGHYITVEFLNNTVHGGIYGLAPQSFKMTNLLIRAVENEE